MKKKKIILILVVVLVVFVIFQYVDMKKDEGKMDAKEETSKDVLNDYVDAFLANNPNITYQEALDTLLQNTEMPTHIITPSRIKPLLQAKMGAEDDPVLVYSISGNKSLKIVKGNIFLTEKNNKEEQITFSGLDTEAIFSPNEKRIAFLRENPERVKCYGDGCRHGNEIWLYNLEAKEQKMIPQDNPEKDWELNICNIHNLTFLPNDNQNIYFMSPRWVTSNAISKINILTKEIKFIIDGNSMEAINDGEYKGNLLVFMHRYPHYAVAVYGAYDKYFVISPEGEKLLAIGDKDDFYNGDYFQTTQEQRDDFMKDVEKFFNIEFPKSNIEGVKRIVGKEKRGEKIYYNISYPEFEENEPLGSVGFLLDDHFSYIPGNFSKSIIDDNFFDGSLIYNDYEITLLTDSVVSVRFDFYMRRADESEGIYKTGTFNIKSSVEDFRDGYVEYKDIFKADIDYLSILSEIAEEKLINTYKTKGKEYDKDLIRKATMPDSGNLEKFNLSENALIITFDADKTEFSLDKKQTIKILYTEIKEYINLNGPIGNLVYK